jgi:hypothetical protein
MLNLPATTGRTLGRWVRYRVETGGYLRAATAAAATALAESIMTASDPFPVIPYPGQQRRYRNNVP